VTFEEAASFLEGLRGEIVPHRGEIVRPLKFHLPGSSELPGRSEVRSTHMFNEANTVEAMVRDLLAG
jgi:hypothetical protein